MGGGEQEAEEVHLSQAAKELASDPSGATGTHEIPAAAKHSPQQKPRTAAAPATASAKKGDEGSEVPIAEESKKKGKKKGAKAAAAATFKVPIEEEGKKARSAAQESKETYNEIKQGATAIAGELKQKVESTLQSAADKLRNVAKEASKGRALASGAQMNTAKYTSENQRIYPVEHYIRHDHGEAATTASTAGSAAGGRAGGWLCPLTAVCLCPAAPLQLSSVCCGWSTWMPSTWM